MYNISIKINKKYKFKGELRLNIPYVMRKCTKCGEWLVASNYNFYKNKNGKWNLGSKCKKCTKECQKEYCEKNKDKKREYDKKWYKENKNKIMECKKEYYKENKDKIIEYQKEYCENNKDKIKEYQKEWYKENKDKIKERHKEYYEKNKDKIIEHQKEYYENNPEKIFNKYNRRRSKLENQGRGITNEQYKECNNWFGWKCAYSGEKLKKTNDTYGRTLDHIIAIDNGGLNEPWNIVPMRRGYNCSKQDKVNSLDWYMEQEYFNIDRLNKIVEWQIYAYEKWGGEEFGELILITDLIEN